MDSTVTNHRGDSSGNCDGVGSWFEVSNVHPSNTPELLGMSINKGDWNYFKVSVSFCVEETREPVNLCHFSTDQTPKRPWRAGLEIGLRQGMLTACLNHGTMPQEQISRYEEVTVGPVLTDGRRHEVNVWKYGEYLGLQVEDDGPVCYWRFPPRQWDSAIAPHLTNIVHIGGRADHNDFKFPGHIETFMFQTGVCAKQALGGMQPTCRMSCTSFPGRVTFGLFQESNDTLGLGVTDVVANMAVTEALGNANTAATPFAYRGIRVTTLVGGPSLTFQQIRRFITAFLPMMEGPLQIEAVGNGTHAGREDLITIDTRLPPGEVSVMAFIQQTRAQVTHLGPPRADTGAIDPTTPLILMSMKIRRPPCAHMPEEQMQTQ